EIREIAVGTVRQINMKLNGVNVIAEEVNVTVDIRDIHEDTRNELIRLIEQAAKNIAKEREIEAKMDHNSTVKPLPIEEKFQQELAESLEKYDINPVY